MKEIHALPQRVPHNQAMATTLQVWHNRNRALMERIAAGLRTLDRPASCRSEDSIRGYAHAHQVMAAHAEHNCPRYRMASDYAAEARP